LTQAAYEALEARFKRLLTLSDIDQMLSWDLSAVMPEGGLGARSEQLATLKVMRHELASAPDMPDLLDAAEAERDGLDDWQRANLREMRRSWLLETAPDARLVEAHSRACHACEAVWRKARAESDFATVLPYLEEVLRLVRELAQARAERLGLPPYDALLEEFEPGGRTVEIDRVLDPLADFLPGFVDAVLERQGARPAPLIPEGPFPVATQRALGERLMAVLGFDFARGRLDTSAHPFCGGVPEDVRITTRYDETDFTKGLMAILHETGHALYEQGLPAAWRYRPVGLARGMAVHESQSLLMEMQACRGRAFLEYAAPLMREAFAATGPAWQPDNLYRLYTRVERGFIRVDADEVTYPAHVILRYRLEKAMIAGDLTPHDLPGAWSDGLAGLLGIRPPDDRLGCLQDIHWYDGAWGYFPTYTLGAMTAAQLYAAAVVAVPEIPEAIGRGDFAPLLGWLRTHVHSAGSRYEAGELVRRATGSPLDPEVFKRHLKARYLDA
jgi:carboxypeptidase Taq